MDILKKELKYLLFSLKKFWVLLLIPALLSIYMYIIDKISAKSMGDLFQKLFLVYSVSYTILEIALNLFWMTSSMVIVLYICKLHFKMKIRKKTVFFLVLTIFMYLFLTDLVKTFVFHNRLFYTGFIDKINNVVAFIFSTLLLPFCVFKIKDIIKINIIFIRKYFLIFILLLILNIIFDKIIDAISNLSYIKTISKYTFSNIVENTSDFLLILTVISFKNRKLMQEKLLILLKKARNKLHK